MRIAKVKDMYFEVPDRTWFSFFNSPYPGHKLGAAIDVYFSAKALFPFEEGTVKEIRKIRTPRHVPVETDYLTIIQVKNYCLKTLHIKPSIKVNEKLYLGQEIGQLIVSGFFRPWSDKHAHFELRNCKDAYRARGGFMIEPLLLNLIPSIQGNEFEIVERKSHYYWLDPLRKGNSALTPLVYQNTPIEGGLPHYGYGAIFGEVDEVTIFKKEVNLKDKLANKVGIFNSNFEVLVNDQRVTGIGIYCNQRIKLIGGEFREGDVVKLSIR